MGRFARNGFAINSNLISINVLIRGGYSVFVLFVLDTSVRRLLWSTLFCYVATQAMISKSCNLHVQKS